MADNYLITGYWGEPHVTAENDRGINAAIFGAGRFVLPVGEQFKAEYIGNNTVRLYDGKLLDNGAAAGIPAGKYIDLLIPEAGQGMSRNDLIVFQYSRDLSTLVESGTFVVVEGTETADTATDPELTQEDLLSDEAVLDQFALWRVPVSGATISDPVQLFSVSKNMKNAGGVIIPAYSDDGVAYTATAEGIDELYEGLTLRIIPDVVSASTSPTLDLNGLGAVRIAMLTTMNNAAVVAPPLATWLSAQRPVEITYHVQRSTTGTIINKYWIVEYRRTSASTLYGSVPIENGGHGGTTAEEARNNLGIPEGLDTNLVKFVSGALQTLGGDSVDLGGAKVVYGTYDGELISTAGSSYPKSLTFDFEPKFVLIFDVMSGNTLFLSKAFTMGQAKNGPFFQNGYFFIGTITYTFNGNTVEWYPSSLGKYATFGKVLSDDTTVVNMIMAQCNLKGATYSYIAIG